MQPDKATATLNYARGVDNRSHETKLAPGFARVADNVDIAVDGTVSTREGYSQLAALSDAHSLWAHDMLPFALAAAGNTLYRIDEDGALTALQTGLSGHDVHYAYAGGRAYWSDDVISGTVKPDGTASTWGVEVPLPSFYLTATTNGGLHAGRYGVTMTFASTAREEGGAPEPVYIDVAEGGGIQVNAIPSPLVSGPPEARVYRTATNSPQFMYAQSVATGTTQVFLGAQILGRPLTTLLKQPFPAARCLLAKSGRIFGAVGRTLVWTDPLYFGLADTAGNFRPYPERIDMIVAPDSTHFVLYVGTASAVYMLSGESIATATQIAASTKGCVPGSMVMVPPEALNIDGLLTASPVWVGTDGVPYVGTESGVLPLHKKFVFPIYEKATAAFAQSDGQHRYIVSGYGGQGSSLAMSDSLVATVYDNGGGA